MQAEFFQKSNKLYRIDGVTPKHKFDCTPTLFKQSNLTYKDLDLIVTTMYGFLTEDFLYGFSTEVKERQIKQTELELDDYIEAAKIEAL